jgi:hypothetical protein
MLALISAEEAEHHDKDLALLTKQLDFTGVKWEIVHWHDNNVDWGKYTCAKIQSPWDYHKRIDEFQAWLSKVAQVTTLLNPIPIINWNIDKRYLKELINAGIPTIQTTFVENEMDLCKQEHILDNDIIVKPAISAGSNDTFRFISKKDEAYAHAKNILSSGRTVLIQPYLKTIDTFSESGIIFINGKFGHAISKSAIFGDTKNEHNGLYFEAKVIKRDPTPLEKEFGERIIVWLTAKFGRVPLYARIDTVIDASGSPVVMELELLEPSLFLHLAEEADTAAMLAAACADALNQAR